MSYRDWGRGEGDPRARQPISSWDERAAAAPVDAYLPRWALESGVRRADGGGRHAAPDDEDDEPERAASGGWRTTETTSSWHRVRETRWQESPAITSGADSDHTGEWTFDRPQGQGYVGSRRADAADDEPVSGSFAERRPRRATTRRPPVTWSGGEEPSTGEPAERREAERDRPTRRARRAAEESWSRPEEPWSRPAADPWDRASQRDDPDPAYQPAVDPWDASGVHTWPASGEVDRWDASGVNALPTAGTADRWDASGVNALPAQGTADRWDAPRGGGAADRWDSTGQWEQPGVPGRWDQPESTGQWERVADAGPWDRTEPPRSRRADEEGWPAQDEGFWSGTRLAGDDPRWMDPSASAPRSPAVSYTAPRPRSAPGAYGPGRRPDPIGAPRGSGRPTVRRRVDVGTGPWQRRLEDDLLDPDPGGPFRPLLYTAACYLIPAVLIFAWLLTLDANPPAGCVTDITGGGCDSARAHALDSLVAGAPRFGLALVSSLVVAALLRRVGTTWRATTVALASAVVGGGLSTVMISAVTGQPIG